MRLQMEISEADVQKILNWASVSRTLQEAARLLAEAEYVAPDDDVLFCRDELLDICPWLDRLHSSVRNAIWSSK